ncbi:MAG: stimulus-sensing domain-containing protein [Alphaproteobacteria bacterium]|nr:stimulus-sensing domain-containing protein [Alphaproteobacteria bacterium]
MSALTFRILAVNIIAIMILGLGILYMGQYTDSLIRAELESMRDEARLFAGAIAEGAVRPVFQMSAVPFEDPMATEAIKPELARRMVRRLGDLSPSRLRLFSVDGSVLTDSHQLRGPGGVVQMEQLTPEPGNISFDSLFSQSATRFLDLIPTHTRLPTYPEHLVASVFDFPDTQTAMIGNIKATAWERQNGRILLTAAAPIQKVKQVMGVVMLIRDGSELEKDIAEVRVDVFRVFLGALGITVMLSIYLSGLISKPLQKLARAAESVRVGKGRATDIPDMSDRNDEIGELSIALRDMTQALWDRMDTIERFAADVSHEIKNPLTSLRSAVETALRVKDDASREKLMDIILHDVKRLDRLISDISSASRLDSELSRDEMTRVDLKALLYRLRDALKKPLARTGEIGDIETGIVLDIPEDLSLLVRGNDSRLGQVFSNLISNALSFSPEDGKVTIRARQAGALHVVMVEDEGPGIPENKLETVFERFYSERPKSESYGNHSGLGLSITRQIVEAHGGRIRAENKRGENGHEPGQITGARFIVELPRLEITP